MVSLAVVGELLLVKRIWYPNDCDHVAFFLDPAIRCARLALDWRSVSSKYPQIGNVLSVNQAGFCVVIDRDIVSRAICLEEIVWGTFDREQHLPHHNAHWRIGIF